MRFLSIPLAGLLALAIIVACHNSPTAPVSDGPELAGVAMDDGGGVVVQVVKKKKVNNRVYKDDVDSVCKKSFTIQYVGDAFYVADVDKNLNGAICYKTTGNGKKTK